MKNYILGFFLTIIGTSAFAGHEGGVARVIDSLPLVALESGTGIFSTVIENSNVDAEMLIEDSANVISTYRSGLEYNFNVDWDNQIVDFENSSATFDEVIIEADQILSEIE